ncbi:dual oxidase 2-like [Neocloeon triangulifer]|uniref:dual oxidase 2-like n=1 Tax=Neocloeon triangulifer TaxID=2078957 RepID=UPI00286F942A|nr:dual oxidase 2-like [Neocloeon triangulifer]
MDWLVKLSIFLWMLQCTGAQAQGHNEKPSNAEWIQHREPAMKTKLVEWLVTGCWSGDGSACPSDAPEPQHAEYPGYDGWYNNLAHPELGAADTALLRRTPAYYEDSVYKPVEGRPNPFTLSDKLLKGPIGTKSRTGKTALLVFFGQQMVEEILDAQRPACPPEYFNIPIPEGHEYRNINPKHTEMPLLRTRYDMRTGFSPNNPRQQLNEITPYIDGGLTYGTTKAWADQLRVREDGTLEPGGLLASAKNQYLYPAYNTQRLPLANPPPPANHSKWIVQHETANVNRFFKLGNPRGNENPFLLTFGVVWFRWHNALAKMLKQRHHEWSDEKIFNEARKWLIATHQRIVIYEWLPAWLSSQLPEYKGYNPAIDPQIDQFFQTSAMRFGHTLVVPGVYQRDYAEKNCTLLPGPNVVRTCNFFWRPQEPMQRNIPDHDIRAESDIDRLLMGMAYQLSEAEDHTIVEDLRGRVFGPLEFSRRDLMAVNIQRGREHGIPDFNTAREAYGLRRYTSENDFTHAANQSIKEELKRLYSEGQSDPNAWLNRIDVWVGGIMETGDSPGELFTAVIKDQFTRIRDGDRFWFENKRNKLFTDAEIARIHQIRFRDVVMSVTHMLNEDMQENPFLAPTPEEIPESCRDNPELHESDCSGTATGKCRHLHPLDESRVEACTRPDTYDYFSNSELSFILTFSGLATIIVAMIGTLFLMVMLLKRKTAVKPKPTNFPSNFKNLSHQKFFAVEEWVSWKEGYHQRVIIFNKELKQLEVCCPIGGTLLHKISFNPSTKLTLYKITDNLHFLVRAQNLNDLCIRFPSLFNCLEFIGTLNEFAESTGCKTETRMELNLKTMKKEAITKIRRQKKLEEFFKNILHQLESKSKGHGLFSGSRVQSSVTDAINMELTQSEFADYFNMRPNSEFITQMFGLIDKDNNGFISFREFFDLFVIFKKGTAEEKSELLFDMYDIDGNGLLTKAEFLNMIRSLLEIAQADVEENLETAVETLMKASGLEHKENYDKKDFQQFMSNQTQTMNSLSVDINTGGEMSKSDNNRGRRESIISIYGDPRVLMQEIAQQKEADSKNTDKQVIQDEHAIPHTSSEEPNETDSWIKRNFISIKRSAENYRMHIFWCTLYTLVLLSIFAERAYYYSVEREHAGLRRIAGYGVTITRGAASAMMFTYSTLLITMCRNTITYLRETFLSRYIPLDSAVEMHKYIAIWALIFTIFHCIGHGINFYHISTQTSDDLTCLFRNFFHATHEIPKFHYWCWQTLTGVTGILLVIVGALIYIFAIPYSRRHLHNWFWNTHNLYPIFYALIVLHGSARLVQEPYFHYFFLGPCVLFTLDNLVTMSRKKVKIPLVGAQILPSDVTMLQILKPSNFNYKSGQWVRIACPELNLSEYHPFTLSSAPNEEHLSLHIRAVGPWTWNIRRLIKSRHSDGTKKLPKIYLDGPYGESHQDWNTYDVSILVGGGIGVTPFASILKDIVFNANIKAKASQHKCKKVYFFWVTKTQKHFEWLVDIIRELESVDSQLVVSVHIFVTQFFEKFDMRTMLLYICERHFQRASGRSLFTGLKARTHFGRPNFKKMFLALSEYHSDVKKIGVFSCGPPALTHSVNEGASDANKHASCGSVFEHHSENF